MKVHELRLNGLKLIKVNRFDDERGFFIESYRYPLYKEHGMELSMQDNLAFSRKNVLRGLHFQSFPGQAKLVSVIQGIIWDVAVDCRLGSPTFGEWEAVVLNGEEHSQFFIPIGFAHGYCVLSDTAYVQYKVSAPYDPVTEKSIRWNDPTLNISWPITQPIISIRDQTSPLFKKLFQ